MINLDSENRLQSLRVGEFYETLTVLDDGIVSTIWEVKNEILASTLGFLLVLFSLSMDKVPLRSKLLHHRRRSNPDRIAELF